MTLTGCSQGGQWRMALSAILDGETPAVPRGEVDAHLRSCPDCAAWWERARTLDVHVRQAELQAPDLSRRIIGVVEARICGCHTGGECECTDCQCPACTCRPEATVG